jgi:hypothetical protein
MSTTDFSETGFGRGAGGGGQKKSTPAGSYRVNPIKFNPILGQIACHVNPMSYYFGFLAWIMAPAGPQTQLGGYQRIDGPAGLDVPDAALCFRRHTRHPHLEHPLIRAVFSTHRLRSFLFAGELQPRDPGPVSWFLIFPRPCRIVCG